ncbi:MAG: hypothetical protein EXR77_14610 [Myxococcales bacterium]|nr:hypothetical protein [Myxococcales bacterium]
MNYYKHYRQSMASMAHRAGIEVMALRAVVLVAACLLLACNQGTTIGSNQSVGEAKQQADRTVSGNELKQKGGLCDINRRVTNPDPTSAEGVIWRLYQVAQKPDTEESFKEFAALFPATKNVREIKENYWGRMRSNVHKFVAEAGKPDYTICRTAYRDDGKMYYIITKDPRQSPPPITVGLVDGVNKIVFLTPF